MNNGKPLKKKSILLLVVILVAAAICIGVICAMHFSHDPSSDSLPNNTTTRVETSEDAAIQLAELGDALGYKNALSELAEGSITTVDGDNYFRFQQTYQGLPVYGRTAVYVTDKNGKAIAITGNVQDVDESLHLSPTVTDEQLVEAVQLYLAEINGFGDIESIETSFTENTLCIYNLGADEKSYLAYYIEAIITNESQIDIFEVVVDANTGNVLHFTQKNVSDTDVELDLIGQESEYTNIICSVGPDGYKLEDLQLGIKAYEIINKQTLLGFLSGSPATKYDGVAEIVWSQEGAPDEAAVDAYINTQISYKFFCEVLQNESTDGQGKAVILLLTEAGEYANTYLVDNACAISGEIDGVQYTKLVFGMAQDNELVLSAYLDTVAHEYMHSVEAFHSGMTYIGESGAIMEALSDIFGELVESWHNEKSGIGNGNPDWVHNIGRNLHDPESSGNPWEYFGENWGDTSNPTKKNDYGNMHNNSTVISHAAYLMWNGIDGNKGKMLSTDDLAKLWYRAMLMMPSDCDFYECRSLVELAAQSMDLTANQLLCIGEAFDAVGIAGAGSVDYEINKGAVLNVYGSDGELYENYTISIAGVRQVLKEDADLTNIREQNIFLFPMITEGQYYQTIEVTKAEDAVLDLDVGTYSITLIDSQGSGNSVSFKVRVGGSDKKEHLEIYTDFNADKSNTGNNGDSNNTEDGDSTLSYDIGSTRDFSDGVAWVEIRKKEDGVIVDSWWACIDTTGDILFELGTNTFTPNQFENGVSLCRIYDEEYNVAAYNIIDKSGNIVFSSEDGLFDAVIAQSGGCFAVYTYTESFKDAGYSVFFLNSNGEITTRMEGLHAEIPELINCGEGVFAEKIRQSAAALVTYRFYNAKTGNQYEIGDIGVHTEIKSIFHNGYAVIRGQRMGDAQRLVSTDGEVTVLSCFGYGSYEFGPVSDGGFVCTSYSRDKVETVWFYDIATGSLTRLGNYGERVKLSRAGGFYFDNGHMLLPLVGADGKNYYTIVDKSGNSLFEPTVCESAYAEGNDRIAVKFEDKTVVYNGKGEAIFELPVGQSVDSYVDGIARIVREDYSISKVYIDLMGNILLDDDFLDQIQNVH